MYYESGIDIIADETKDNKEKGGQMSKPYSGQLAEICEKFRIESSLDSVETLTDGIINKTFKVNFTSGKSYLLQQINSFVFARPEQVMGNIDLVTAHIMKKNPDGCNLHFHHTADGKNYYIDKNGSFWRLRNFLDAVTFNTCDDIAVLENAGRAFGRFQNMLSDFDASVLCETIPGFHNTVARMETLFAHASSDPMGRAAEVARELDFISSVREKATELCKMTLSGAIPTRVTHNDTKISNVLFDKNTRLPLTVIDLDTVMPGMAAYDFGDTVRSAAGTASEDERDLSIVSLDIAKFEAYAKGFVSETRSGLTKTEIDTLARGAFCVTVEQAVRFLDDYLTGDKYYKISYPLHNLCRARCQLKLAGDMLEKLPAMEKTVAEYAAL